MLPRWPVPLGHVCTPETRLISRCSLFTYLNNSFSNLPNNSIVKKCPPTIGSQRSSPKPSSNRASFRESLGTFIQRNPKLASFNLEIGLIMIILSEEYSVDNIINNLALGNTVKPSYHKVWWYCRRNTIGTANIDWQQVYCSALAGVSNIYRSKEPRTLHTDLIRLL